MMSDIYVKLSVNSLFQEKDEMRGCRKGQYKIKSFLKMEIIQTILVE